MTGLPGTIINTLLGSLATYGMAGLRNDGRSIILYSVVNVVQAGIATQLVLMCIFFTSNQVRLLMCMLLSM